MKLPGIDRGPQRRALPPRPEHVEQALLVRWARLLAYQYPALNLLAAVPNGGYRHKATARLMSAEGLSPGYPDLLLDAARQGYHGLRIEMKRRGNRPTEAQLAWHERLRAEGYRVEVCYSASEAANVIADYLGLPKEARM